VKHSRGFTIPSHAPRQYAPVGECIYCRCKDRLTKEHVIPYSAGGRWVLPEASCRDCAAATGAFEGEFARTILGPLRMLYNMPTRRPKDRPKHLPLKVKYRTSIDWEIAYVDRGICPFLVGLPLYPMPDALTGVVTEGDRTSATSQLWIRGAGFWPDRDAHMQWLCDALGATAVMPTATVNTAPFCLALAKIAHAFAVAELGLGSFEPFLTRMILQRDLSDRAKVIGGGRGNEPPSDSLHEIAFSPAVSADPNIVAVRMRLLAFLGTPTYHVAVGRKN
jgi:HNH endonuclease